MKNVVVAALVALSIAAQSDIARAGNDCRQFKPSMSIVVGSGSIPPQKRQGEIHYHYRGSPSCWDAVHVRFGLAGRDPYVNREIKSGKNCGVYINGRSLPACVLNVGPLDFNTTYVAGLQECDKHALSHDECSSWSSFTVTTPAN